MIALTMSLSHFLRALTALPFEQLACCITSSMSFASTPSSSTSSSDSSSTGGMALAGSAIWPVGLSGALNFSAAAIWACWERSSILASPKTMYVSDPGD